MTQNYKVSLIMFLSLIYCYLFWVITDLDTLIFNQTSNEDSEPIELKGGMLFNELH